MKKIIIFLTIIAGLSPCCAQQTASRLDSIQRLNEVEVTGVTMRSVIPSQRLQGEELRRLNSLSVADALRYFSGLQVKDYGGVGGIKTVNIRSMGTNHLGVFYDGVELGNAQNGQIDLGQFSLDNVDEISLYNGQKSMIFQPAADFGNAGSVYIRTRRPVFLNSKSYNLKMRFKYGSSDMARLSAVYEQRLSDMISLSVSAEGLTSSGKYKFRYRRKNLDGTVAYDTTATRQNGDIKALRAEANLYGLISHGNWGLKAYSYNSERGIPGAIVNNVWRRGERQWDNNHFVQGSFQKSFGRFDTQLKVKYAYYNTHYVNNDTTQMLIDNTYRQQELYVSSANVYELTRGWSVAACYDFKWNKLDADMRSFVYPHRFQNMAAVATAYSSTLLDVQGSVLATAVKDHSRYGTTQKAMCKLTPAVFLSVRPLLNNVLTVRAFAKKSFRMPTFNDLFYTDMGNSKLKPEAAIQYDFGFSFTKNLAKGLIRHFSIQADGYYNTVHDKIVAYPKGQQFRWTMLNLGRTHITGLDVEGQLTAVPSHDLTVTMRAQYTFQRAIDVTDPADSYYRNQIPYIPRHSGSALLGIIYKRLSVNYSFIYAGERYSQKENILYNKVQPWYTSDLSMTYQMKAWKTDMKLTVEVNNLFSQDYDVIINYPMPKRNYAVSLDISI